MTMRPLSWACGHGNEMLLIKNKYSRPDYSPIISDMTVQRNVPRFCRRSICGWNLFQPLGLGQKWNESGFRPPLCTYRLNWARRTSWGWWDDWDDTVLQTQDSKFEPWRSEAEHATSRSRRLPTGAGAPTLNRNVFTTSGNKLLIVLL